jgi:hypothetical protein
VPHELVGQVSHVPFAEDDEVIKALGPDGLHEALRVWVAVRALRRNLDAFHAVGLKERRALRSEDQIRWWIR